MNKKTANAPAVVSSPPLPKQYGTELLVLESGRGCRLTDRAGRRYLDLGSGISVNALGYGREDLAEIAADQMRRLIHVSNLFATEPELETAEKLLALPSPAPSAFTAVHFGNSGTEANESAIKYGRLYARARRGEGNHGLVGFTGSFHGRTLGALSLTANPKYREPFAPLVPGAEILPYNDVAALQARLDGSIAVVMVEVLQGEGGLEAITPEFAGALNTLCRKHDILLVADEVQTGLGRCGAVFASSLYGLEPDMVTLSKPLAGGLPLSATLIPEKVNDHLAVGHHATTFGGGPVTTAVAGAVLDIISDGSFLEEVKRKGDLLQDLLSKGLAALGTGVGNAEIRGKGLLMGLRIPGKDGSWCGEVISACRERGLLILKTGSDVLRLAPPLVIDDTELAEGVALLFTVIKEKLG